MGNVIRGAFGAAQPEGDQPAAAGGSEPGLPAPQALAARLEQALSVTRSATTRLANLVAPGSANEEQLVGLFTSHVTIQDNLADVATRLQSAMGDQNLAEGAYLGITNDLDRVEGQVQSYVEAVEKVIGEQPQSQAIAPVGAKQPNWLLWGVIGLGVAGASFGTWMFYKNRKKKR